MGGTNSIPAVAAIVLSVCVSARKVIGGDELRKEPFLVVCQWGGVRSPEVSQGDPAGAGGQEAPVEL